MKQFSLRKTLPAPDQTPEPESGPDPNPPAVAVRDTAPAVDSGDPPTLKNHLVCWLQQNKVVLGLTIVFLVFWNLADWTLTTGSRMRPGQYTYSNEMAQLWTAAYRLVFIVVMTVIILKFTAPTLIRYWRRDVDPDFDAARDFQNHLTPHQRLWFSFALLFALCYLFILLLGVKLPESPSVGL